MSKTSEEKGGLFFLLLLLVIGAGGYFWWQSGAESREQEAEIAALLKAERAAKFEALHACRTVIAATAKYGTDNRPGFREPTYSRGAWQFVWPHGSFFFKNGFGVEVPQSAACVVAESNGEIIYLSVSGNELIK